MEISLGISRFRLRKNSLWIFEVCGILLGIKISLINRKHRLASSNFHFPIEQPATRRPLEEEEDVKTTFLEANIYYQVFAKFLKIHLTQLRNVSSYDVGKHSNIKLKVMVCNNTSGRKLTETSR